MGTVKGRWEQIKLLALVGVLLTGGWWWMRDPPVVVGPDPGPQSRILILLHGHGASKNDLQFLAEQLVEGVSGLTVVMPSAPHRAGPGRTWYPSFRVESKALVEVKLRALREQARAVVFDLVEGLKNDGVSAAQILVGGFSQGGTVALDVVMGEGAGSQLGGLVSLSAGGPSLDLTPLDARDRMPAFVSHGESDSVVPMASSRKLVRALEAGGHEVTFVDFPGGHTVPESVIRALGVFLSELFSELA